MILKMKFKTYKIQSRIKKINPISFFFCLFIITNISPIQAQEKYVATHDDSLALENVITEVYYVSDSSDLADTSGGVLSQGAVTYRIYIDMKPGYSLQMVYGNQKHELFIKTDTKFFNNQECGALTGFNVDARRINDNSVALDSWITMGAATRLHTGILKADDKDGSVIKRATLDNTDGLTKGELPNFKIFNLDLNFFNDPKNASDFRTNNGGWAAPGGVKGPTNDNRVLIAQLTTNGKLNFELNIQIGTPTGGYVQFVAKRPEGSEIQSNKLTYN
jgi:hypothetical protein